MKKISRPFSETLPVLEAMVATSTDKKLLYVNGIAFVCVQHLLYTTFNLMKSLNNLGVPRGNIHIMGKSYSSCSVIIKKLIDEGYCYYPNSFQEKLGSFSQYFKQDVECMWGKIFEDLNRRT